jgi:hypothetical protein
MAAAVTVSGKGAPALPSTLRVATGLRLRLDEAGEEPADLRVASVRPVRLPPSPASEALDADGRIWRRLWLCADRMVVEFVDLAAAEVHADGAIVLDRELPPDLSEHLVLDHLLALELARRGQVVLHGAVLSLGQRAAVLVGPSGAGKSTLTASAWRQGWAVGGDDGAVLGFGHPLTAEPTYPTIRLSPAAAELAGATAQTGSAVVGKRRLSDTGSTRPFHPDPVPLALVAVVTPVPAGAPAALERIRGVDAHATLFGHVFHADLGGGPLMRDVVDRLVAVAETVTVARLSVPRGREGLVAAEQVLRQEISR